MADIGQSYYGTSNLEQLDKIVLKISTIGRLNRKNSGANSENEFYNGLLAWLSRGWQESAASIGHMWMGGEVIF